MMGVSGRLQGGFGMNLTAVWCGVCVCVCVCACVCVCVYE